MGLICEQDIGLHVHAVLSNIKFIIYDDENEDEYR